MELMHRFALSALLLCAACSGDATPTKEPQTPAPAPQPVGQDAKITFATEPNAMDVVDVRGPLKKDSPAMRKQELGELLFFDPRLSASGKTSCSTCHLPEMGWTDGKQLSTKDDGSVNKRHSPTLVNVGYCENLYWDGRAPSMEKNVTAAWKGQMSGDPAKVSETLSNIPSYRERFQQAFQEGPSEVTISRALAAFVQSIRGQNSAYDRYIAGDANALTQDQKAGHDLFLGKAGCVTCHLPPLFTDKSFHNTGIGMDKPEPDLGRGAHLKDPKLNGYFKTPSLRDVAKSAPYFHDGSIATLEEAVKFMASGGRDNPTKSPQLLDRKLSDGEIKAIAAFLTALTSEVKYTPPTLPN